MKSLYKSQYISASASLLLYSLLTIPTFVVAQEAQAPKESNTEMYGNPYLVKDWSDGAVKFSSGRVVTQFRLRFDCVKNQLLLHFQGSTFAAESKVQEFVMYTGSGRKKDSVLFRKGYPPVGKANESTYYHVLLDDRVQLLRLISKNIVEEKQLIASSGVHGRLEEDEKYFLYKDGNMIHLPDDKTEFFKALPDHAGEVAQFMNEKNIRLKNPAEFQQVIRKYLELQQ